MPLQRSEVKLGIYNNVVNDIIRIPVIFTEELNETGPFDMIWTSAGGYADYLFVGYFADEEGFTQWYFANARRHEEMRQAIEATIGPKQTYVYGQLWFDKEHFDKEGEMRFRNLQLQSELPDEEAAMNLFMNSIAREYLRDGFYMYYV